tara:strand:- start:160 stop:810 length:651 start_codon:yes stop_codon:yes gene_type:complete
METLLEFFNISPNDTVAFILINALWAAFFYFNKKRHEKELQSLQHSLNLDLERRKKVFELKMVHYERYVKMLDDFGRKYQSELFIKMQPSFNEYIDKMLNAQNEQTKSVALSQFSMSVMELMNESMREYSILKSESRALKLTAGESLLIIFEDLESLVETSVESVKLFINELPILILSGDQEGLQEKQSILDQQGREIQEKSKELERKMRLELNEI